MVKYYQRVLTLFNYVKLTSPRHELRGFHLCKRILLISGLIIL